MKRAAALGMMALTVAVNFAPIKVEAAGLNTCPQNFYGANTITSIKNCNLEDLTSNLQNLQINGNCNLGSIDQIKDAITKAEKTCNTNTKDTLSANYGNPGNCKTQSTENKVTTQETATQEAAAQEAAAQESAQKAAAQEAAQKAAAQESAQKAAAQESAQKAAAQEAAQKAAAQEAAQKAAAQEAAQKATAQQEVKNENNNTVVSYAEKVVKLVNEERAKEGLAPLGIDKNVEKAALVRAKEIQSSFSHTRPNGSSFATVLKENGVTYRGAGENIAWGQKTPEQVVTAWMNSPGHRANIMNAKYTKIGVGNLQNNAGTQYWVQLFTY